MTLVLLLALLAPSEATTPWEKAKAQLLADARALLPHGQDTRLLLFSGLGLGLMVAMDRPASRELAKAVPQEVRHFEPLGRFQVGNILGLAVAGGGILAQRSDWQRCGLTLVEANLLTSWLVTGVQRLAGRARPRQPHGGHFGRGGSSFPSAHAAHAFAWAGVLSGSWPQWRGRWALPLVAAGVALSRVQERHHFLGDVALGGAFGWWVGYRLGRAHRWQSPPQADIVPIVGGLALRMRWP